MEPRYCLKGTGKTLRDEYPTFLVNPAIPRTSSPLPCDTTLFRYSKYIRIMMMMMMMMMTMMMIIIIIIIIIICKLWNIMNTFKLLFLHFLIRDLSPCSLVSCGRGKMVYPGNYHQPSQDGRTSLVVNQDLLSQGSTLQTRTTFSVSSAYLFLLILCDRNKV